jgi:hypothetical protein
MWLMGSALLGLLGLKRATLSSSQRKFNVKRSLSILLLLAFAPVVGANTANVFASRVAFTQSAGDELKFEDWTSYKPGTLLDGVTIRGVNYHSSSSEQLVVGSRHGANWLLGYLRESGRYASFSSETITFAFSDPVVAFGIALSQGNSSGSNSYDGTSEWLINIDSGSLIYTSIATYSQSDFTGEAYLGLLGLPPATSFAVTRLRSNANIVWDIRDISWIPVSDVPLPSAALLGITSLVFLAMVGRRKKTRA